VRRFDDVNRYVANAGVDFHSRFGIGVRPEVLFGWSDRQQAALPTIVCPACSTGQGATFAQVPPPPTVLSRSQLLGVNLNATYTMLRGSFARPYLIGGVGLLTTREPSAVVASAVPLASAPQVTQLTYRVQSTDHTEFGLNAGAGLEFGHGPVRVFTEFRYFLSDSPTPRGFSGMLPITAGLRF
jgi:opacity protein-like surface antigen